MKWYRMLAVTGALAVFAPGVANAASFTLCNTGQGSGCVGALAGGTEDPNYALTAYVGADPANAHIGQAIVVDASVYPLGLGGPWIPDDSNSGWIGNNILASSDPLGVFDFQTTFDLTGLIGQSITGRFAADNAAAIFLNGVSTGFVSAGYGSYTNFSITSGFIDYGMNTLDFLVLNTVGGNPNPVGLRVDDIETSAVPEPTSILLLGSGIISAYRSRRRLFGQA